MHFTCAFDLKVPAKRRHALYELLACANERLWIGHFGMDPDDGMPVFRHAVLLRGAPGASSESLEDMVDIAITECERFFPAFQFVLWGGKIADRGAGCRHAGVRRGGMSRIPADPAGRLRPDGQRDAGRLAGARAGAVGRGRSGAGRGGVGPGPI